MSRSTLLAALAALGLTGCGEANVERYEPAPTPPPVTDFTLRTGVVPIITSEGCTSCHNANLFSGQLDLDVAPSLVRENLLAGGSSAYGETIDLLNPEDSLILVFPTHDSSYLGHGKYFGFDDPRYETILGWIANGAQDD